LIHRNRVTGDNRSSLDHYCTPYCSCYRPLRDSNLTRIDIVLETNHEILGRARFESCFRIDAPNNGLDRSTCSEYQARHLERSTIHNHSTLDVAFHLLSLLLPNLSFPASPLQPFILHLSFSTCHSPPCHSPPVTVNPSNPIGQRQPQPQSRHHDLPSPARASQYEVNDPRCPVWADTSGTSQDHSMPRHLWSRPSSQLSTAHYQRPRRVSRYHSGAQAGQERSNSPSTTPIFIWPGSLIRHFGHTSIMGNLGPSWVKRWKY